MKKGRIFLMFLIILFLTGCSGLKEATKGFLGVSTKILEESRTNSLKKDFSGSLADIHQKIIAALTINKSYIYKDAKSKDFIALYVSKTDTTPVGIFLTEISAVKVGVEVSSPSTDGREFISKVIFDALKEFEVVKEEKGNIDAGK
jgi:hypothetical protein